jgi:hypothetical protein
MLTIPSDLATWRPNDVTAWLSNICEDRRVTDQEFAAAQAAVHTALLSPTGPTPVGAVVVELAPFRQRTGRTA